MAKGAAGSFLDVVVEGVVADHRAGHADRPPARRPAGAAQPARHVMGGAVRRVVEGSRDRPPRDAQADVEDRIARPDGEQLVALGIAVVPAGELARLAADTDHSVSPPRDAARNTPPDPVEATGRP